MNRSRRHRRIRSTEGATRSGVICGLLAAVLLCHGAARADDGARQHFEAGKHLRDEGDCGRALGEFERSLATERSIGALYNLGYCHEQLGHRQDAYDAYRGARELASQKRDGRLREISGAIATLLETPHIRLVLPQPLPEGLQLLVDDELVPATTYAAETVVFTRTNTYHLVVVRAPAYEERRLTVQTKQVAPVELKKSEPKPEPAIVEAPRPPAQTPASNGGSMQRKVGFGFLAGGAVASGFAALLYANHRAELTHLTNGYHQALTGCAGALGCTQKEQQAYNQKVTSANDRAYVFAGGTTAIAAVLLATGVVLFATGGARTPTRSAWTVAPLVSGALRGGALSGTF